MRWWRLAGVSVGVTGWAHKEKDEPLLGRKNKGIWGGYKISSKYGILLCME